MPKAGIPAGRLETGVFGQKKGGRGGIRTRANPAIPSILSPLGKNRNPTQCQGVPPGGGRECGHLCSHRRTEPVPSRLQGGARRSGLGPTRRGQRHPAGPYSRRHPRANAFPTPCRGWSASGVPPASQPRSARRDAGPAPLEARSQRQPAPLPGMRQARERRPCPRMLKQALIQKEQGMATPDRRANGPAASAERRPRPLASPRAPA